MRSPDPDWYRDAFGPLTAAFWTALVPAARVEEEARFLEHALAPPSRAALLDVPCGAGRQARALGRRGFRVTGIDLSPHMLAADASEGAVPGVSLRAGEMTALSEQAAYDGAYCWGNSFGYLSDADTRTFVARLAAALRPGGRFVLDVGSVAEAVLTSFQPRTELTIGEFRFTAERVYALARSEMHIRYTIERGSEKEEFDARMTVYTAGEIVRIANAAGLELLEVHGGIANEPAALGKPFIGIFRRV